MLSLLEGRRRCEGGRGWESGGGGFVASGHLHGVLLALPFYITLLFLSSRIYLMIPQTSIHEKANFHNKTSEVTDSRCTVQKP